MWFVHLEGLVFVFGLLLCVLSGSHVALYDGHLAERV